MNKQEILNCFWAEHENHPQYHQYYKDPKWVKITKNIGARGVTWFKAGDLALITGRVSNDTGKWTICLFSWRKNPIDNLVGNCAARLDRVSFEDKEIEMNIYDSIRLFRRWK